MKFPSEPNETEHTGFVRAALSEAARYEADTVASDDLVAGSLAQHKRCGRSSPLPGIAACGLVLLLGAALWLRMPRRLPAEHPAVGLTATVHPANGLTATVHPADKVVLPGNAALPRVDIVRHFLPPIDFERIPDRTRQPRHRHRSARHAARFRRRTHLVRSSLLPKQTAGVVSVWKTETVRCEVITQTVTPVWVAQADPSTFTVVLAPAFLQISLQPDNTSDSTEAHVSAALIPVRFEQENPQP